MELVKEIYRLSKLFPKDEQFGITSQIRRSSTSVLANLAEGFSRVTPADKAHKYTIARAENSETCAFLYIVIELGILKNDQAAKAFILYEETGKLLTGLINYYSRNAKGPTPTPTPSPS